MISHCITDTPGPHLSTPRTPNMSWKKTEDLLTLISRLYHRHRWAQLRPAASPSWSSWNCLYPTWGHLLTEATLTAPYYQNLARKLNTHTYRATQPKLSAPAASGLCPLHGRSQRRIWDAPGKQRGKGWITQDVRVLTDTHTGLWHELPCHLPRQVFINETLLIVDSFDC